MLVQGKSHGVRPEWTDVYRKMDTSGGLKWLNRKEGKLVGTYLKYFLLISHRNAKQITITAITTVD
jgi:hypothetical protein